MYLICKEGGIFHSRVLYLIRIRHAFYEIICNWNNIKCLYRHRNDSLDWSIWISLYLSILGIYNSVITLLALILTSSSKLFMYIQHEKKFKNVYNIEGGMPRLQKTNFDYFWKKSLKIPKGQSRIRISKKIIHQNGQKKKYKRTNNDLQNIHTKLKIE